MSSLTTPPKINWTADDSARKSDMNEIGVNLNSLDDGKYESGNDITVGDITGEDLTLSGAITPTSSAVEGSNLVSASSTWTIPIGVYMFPVTTNITVQIFVNSTWTASEEGAVFSDGANVRLSNSSGGDITVYFLKF